MEKQNKQNVSLFILDALKKQGIDDVFLVPGAMIRPFLSSFSKVDTKPIISAKEDGAAYMADGYGRARQDFGVCMGIGGPGVTNMVTPISAAYSDRSSVLTIAGSIPLKWLGKGTFQDSSSTGIDDIAILRNMTEFAQILPEKELTIPFLKKAIRAMRAVEHLPAFLSIPLDVQEERFEDTFIPIEKEPSNILDEVEVKKVPEFLKDATRITILAGNGSVWSKAQKEIFLI